MKIYKFIDLHETIQISYLKMTSLTRFRERQGDGIDGCRLHRRDGSPESAQAAEYDSLGKTLNPKPLVVQNMEPRIVLSFYFYNVNSMCATQGLFWLQQFGRLKTKSIGLNVMQPLRGSDEKIEKSKNRNPIRVMGHVKPSLHNRFRFEEKEKIRNLIFFDDSGETPQNTL